jgi:hypothetical protein
MVAGWRCDVIGRTEINKEFTQPPTDLDDLRLSAVARAKESGELSDIEKAVSISKSISDERKAAMELTNADRSFRITRLQSLLSGMLTLISVIGLIGTSFYNIAQFENSRSQAETTEWRDAVNKY